MLRGVIADHAITHMFKGLWGWIKSGGKWPES